jgi:predicted component of type VI protein secretion system
MSLIGSASGCKFRLTDPSVSRFHGCLVRSSAGLWIVDLLGQRGITVNDVPVRSSRLTDGDVLRIGRYRIRVRCRFLTHDSGNRLADRGRATPALGLLYQDRALTGLKFPAWAVAATPSESEPEGAKDAEIASPIQAISSVTALQAVPSDTTLAVNFSQSELVGSMLAPLVNQFGMMQQQMFDQFQQAMAIMVQMFGSMHRDQMEVIRTELDQLRELTEEFQTLKAELASRSRVQSEASKLAVSPTGMDPRTAMESGVSATTPTGKTSKLFSDSTNAPVGPSSLVPPPLWSNTPAEQRPFQDSQFARTVLSSGPPASPISGQPQQPASLSPTKASGADPAAESDRDAVVWLHQRIMSLQRERESRWQKILKLLPGMS